MAAKTYVSRYPNFVLTGPDEGDPKIEFGTQNLQLPGTYITSDEDEQAYIEAHSAFGISVFEDEIPANLASHGVIYDDKSKLRLLLDSVVVI